MKSDSATMPIGNNVPSKSVAQPDPCEVAAREWLTAKSCEAGHIYSAMPPEGSERAYFDSLLGGGVLASLAALLREREAAAERRGAEAMRGKAAQEAESAYPCSCDEAYTTRRLTAPDCFRCVPLDEAACRVRALPLPGDKQGD